MDLNHNEERPHGIPHREDIPFDVLMELTRRIQEEHPGSSIIFGDEMDQMDEEDQELALRAADVLQAVIDESGQNGTCWNCGRKCPGWRNRKYWGSRAPDGWKLIDVNDQGCICAVECPECEGPHFYMPEMEGKTQIIRVGKEFLEDTGREQHMFFAEGRRKHVE